MHLYEFDNVSARSVECQPFFVKGLQLKLQNADFLLEAMLKSMPIDPSDVDMLSDLASKQECLLLTWCCDRASANLSSLKWLFHQLASPSVDSSIMACAELCAAHGVALVKSRAVMGKSLVQVASSFTWLTKNWRLMESMRDSVVKFINENLVVKRERRPESHKAGSVRVVRAIFGELLDSLLAKLGKRGERCKTRLSQDLDDLCNVFSMMPGCGVKDLCHYCWVEPGSVEFDHGLPEGVACCRDRQESVEKMAVPFLNIIVNTSWSNTAASRWTYVVATFRRLCLGYACNGLIASALKDVQTFWNCADGIEATLLRLIAADAGDFHSKSKLRLLRVARGFCHVDSGWKAAIVLVSLLIVDKILFAILGNGGAGSRATLYDLVSVDKSLLARASADLLAKLHSWGQQGSLGWELLEIMGGDFKDEATRMWARAQLLHLIAGIIDVFELRYSRPPYTLLKFIDPDVPDSEKAKAFQSAQALHPHCRPLFVQRLLQQCPNIHSMRGRGVHIMRAFNEGSVIAVDFSERSHAQMRQDMRSSGRAKSASASASRVYCQQVRAELVSRGSLDPSGPSAGPGCVQEQGNNGDVTIQQQPPAHGGNHYLDFLNFSMSTYKDTFAKDAQMTDGERTRVRTRSREAWDAMSHQERERWLVMYRARAMQARLGEHGPPAVDPLVDKKEQKPLWFLPHGTGSPSVPIGDVCSSYSSFGKDACHQIFDNPKLRVIGPVPARASTMLPRADGSDLVFGCCNSRKNICRHILNPNVQREMDVILSLLNKCVDDLGCEVARQASCLLWMRGIAVDPAEGPPVDLVVLLSDPWYSPKMQYWSRCALAACSGEVCFSMPEFPCLIQIAIKLNRLTDRFKQAFMTTSDELAYEAALMVGRRWEIRPLRYTVKDTESLLDMRVLGADEALHRSPPRTRKVPAAAFDEAVFLGDPFVVGTAQGIHGDDDPLPLDDEGLEDGNEAMEEMVAGVLEEDVAADILDCDAGVAEDDAWPDEMGGGGSALYQDDPGLFDGADLQDDSFGVEAEEQEAVDALQGGDVQSAISQAVISSLGYVSVEVPPWNTLPSVGRVTSWPAATMLQNRSCSMKCYMHPGCGSPAKKRYAVEDRQLLEWLFSMQPIPHATQDEKRAAVLEHKAKWATALQCTVPAQSGGSGASSSGHALA